MDIFLTNKGELENYKNNKEIVRKTGLQIRKDFAQFGFDIKLPENLYIAYNTLFDQLSPLIQDMLSDNISRLYSVLYSIDLNESAIRKGISEMNDIPVHDAIAHLILERELKKVITREYFSRNL